MVRYNQHIIKRELKKILLQRLKQDRAIALLGPRQAGKSYLLKEIIKEEGGILLNLDDPLLRDEISQDPLGYLRRVYRETPLFIDEAAKVPAIFDAVKIIIDENGDRPSKICLANSGNYLLMKRLKETLAGRVTLLSLYPLSWREFSGTKRTPAIFNLPEKEIREIPVSFTEVDRLRTERLLWGGYPTPALSADLEQRKRWANNYLKTYIFPLVLDQFSLRDWEAFERCTRILFINASGMLNYNKLSRESGISQPTSVSYVHQLKAMMLITALEGYYKTLKKRIIKQPKVEIVDPLLLQESLSTNFNLQVAKDRNLMGKIYESFITFEIIKTLENQEKAYHLFSWRTADKAEVDLILEIGSQTLPLKIKFSQKPEKRDCSGLLSFLEDNPQVKEGYIIYPGREIFKLFPHITAIPDWWFLGA